MTSNNDKETSQNGTDVIQNNNSTTAEIRVEPESFNFVQEPPPPYTVSATVEPISLPVIHHTVVVRQPLKDHPIIFTCEECRETVLTKVERVNTRKTHMCAGFICGCTLWCMMCCLGAIPYVVPMCKKSKHYCPNCDNFIGDYSKF